MIAFARICAYYAHHAAFLEEDQLASRVDRLRDIPSVMIHGELDAACPITFARDLASRWNGVELVVNEGEGHLGGPKTREMLTRTFRRFAI